MDPKGSDPTDLHLCKLVSTYHKDISCQLQLQEEFEETKE